MFSDAGSGGGNDGDGGGNGIVTIIFGYSAQCGLQLFWFFESITWHRTHFCTQSIPVLLCCVMWCGLALWDAEDIILLEMCVCLCASWYDFIFLFMVFRTNFNDWKEERASEGNPFKLFNKIVAWRGAHSSHWISLDDASLFYKFISFNLLSIVDYFLRSLFVGLWIHLCQRYICVCCMFGALLLLSLLLLLDFMTQRVLWKTPRAKPAVYSI